MYSVTELDGRVNLCNNWIVNRVGVAVTLHIHIQLVRISTEVLLTFIRLY